MQLKNYIMLSFDRSDFIILITRSIRNILKLIFSVGIAEVIYVISRWSIHFYLLTIGYEYYLTSIIAHFSSAIIFTIMINVSVKVTKLFNNI